MNLLGILKALVGAITAAFLALSGAPTAPQQQAIADIASTTDAVVQEAAQSTTAPTKEDISQAYELGKAVGKLQQQTQPIISPATTTMQENTTAGPSGTAPQSTSAPDLSQASGGTAPAPQAASQARIEIVSPIAGKGLGRQYTASPQIVDESNYIELGAILYGADGQPVSTEKMTITASESEQDAIEVGTGDVMTIWPNGNRTQVPVYSFHYEFHKTGEHSITFTSASGVTATTTVSVK